MKPYVKTMFLTSQADEKRYMHSEENYDREARHKAMTRQYEGLTKEHAKHWLSKMKNEDGSTGPHWTFEQVLDAMRGKMMQGDPVKYWVAANMIWSDYSHVAEKFGVNNTDFYLDMAKAFLEDKDAEDHKLEKYFENVVK